jgi:hypothetical protein
VRGEGEGETLAFRVSGVGLCVCVCCVCLYVCVCACLHLTDDGLISLRKALHELIGLGLVSYVYLAHQTSAKRRWRLQLLRAASFLQMYDSMCACSLELYPLCHVNI